MGIDSLRIVIVILCLNIATGCSFKEEMNSKSKYNYSVEDFVKEGIWSTHETATKEVAVLFIEILGVRVIISQN